LDVWTVCLLEQRSLLPMPSTLSRYAHWNTTSRIVPVPVDKMVRQARLNLKLANFLLAIG
jgi:hypothetical protein